MQLSGLAKPIDERLVWSKPEVRRLAVSVDTRFEVGSGEDGGVYQLAVFDGAEG